MSSALQEVNLGTVDEPALEGSSDPSHNFLSSTLVDLERSTRVLAVHLPEAELQSPPAALTETLSPAADTAYEGSLPKASRGKDLVTLPFKAWPRPDIELLQLWRGVVVRVSGEIFGAELQDLTEPETGVEEAEFEVEEIADSDLSLLQIGAAFTWTIAYRTSLDGQKERTSFLRFMRLPAWRETELREIARESSELAEEFGASETPESR